MPLQRAICTLPSISIVNAGAAMKDSLLRDRAGENESAAGAVDKSVVNWLMHVISGKDPLGLGINDASSNDAAPEEAKPQKPILREETKKNDPAAQSLSVSAEDLCGAPVIPILIASKPVYEVVDDEPESSAVVAVTEGTKKPKPDPEPEVSEAGRFKQMFGLK